MDGNLDCPRGLVLIVDDDPVVRLMAAQTLEATGLGVDEADSGEEALRRFDPVRHSLILLDVNMDGIDGFETCRRLRAQPTGAAVPIVMLTGLDDTCSIEKAYRIGATDFITKPINWTLLTHRLRYALRGAAIIEDLERSRARLANAQRIAKLASWEWEPNGDVMRRSAEYARILGLNESDVGTSAYGLLRALEGSDQIKLRGALEAAARGTDYQITYRVRNRRGELATLHEQAQVVRDGDGAVLRVEGITQDVSERAQAQERIRYLAYHDSITGLVNRQFFREAAPFALARARRSGKRCALLYIGLDRLKRVNEMFGQKVGDTYLNEAGKLMLGCLRAGDLVGRDVDGDGEELVARLGGNEFTLLLTDIGAAGDAETVACRLLEVLAQPVQVEHHEIAASSSIGIALFPDHGEDAETLLKHADIAMYVAKEKGGNALEIFTPQMQARVSARLRTELDLRKALGRGELRLHYQPKVDAANGRLVGAEALIRWMHPARGMVAPGEFIPVAEECGMIMPIGEWTIQEACRQMREWRDAGVGLVPVSINLASPNFRHHGLPGVLASALREFGIGAELLRLELTESILMQEVDATREMLGRLKDMGLALSVDDFGTGYSSLSYLRRFPIDELKIDRQFVRDVTEDANGASITAAIIALGQQLRLELVAEGVETVGQARFLLERGCATMQGFLFARPMSPSDFAVRLAAGADFPPLPELNPQLALAG